LNGAKSGIYKLYYKTGQIQIDGFTKDNQLNGFCIHYNEDGKKSKEGEYSMGQPIGIWKEYNKIVVTQKNYGK